MEVTTIPNVTEADRRLRAAEHLLCHALGSASVYTLEDVSEFVLRHIATARELLAAA